jgi:hypothetical protein
VFHPTGVFERQNSIFDRHASPQEVQFEHHLILRKLLPDETPKFLELLGCDIGLTGGILVVKVAHGKAPSNFWRRHDIDHGQSKGNVHLVDLCASATIYQVPKIPRE